MPASTIPGERWSHTQPFSTAMPEFAGPNPDRSRHVGDDAVRSALLPHQVSPGRYRGHYTPLRLGSSVRTPGELGGIDWGSVSVDEGRNVLVVNSNLMAD